MADDGGLELNLVSEPLADLQPKKKKRASGKAWDKKKKRQPTTTTNSSKDSGSTAKQTQQQGKGGSEGKGQPRPQSSAVNSTNSSSSSSRSSSAQKESSETAAVPAVASGSPGQHGRSGTERAKGAGKATAAVTPGARRHSSNATSPNAGANKPGISPRGKKNTTEGGHNDREPLSNERRRVLEMAGRHTTPLTPAAAPPSGDDKPSGGLSSSTRATKRKRPAAGGGATTAGPVASGGVVDFTVGDNTTTPNSSNKRKKKDDPKAEARNRKAAATAAAVAKATAAMAKSGGKWWDDDDDDHVVVAAAKKSKPISTSYYAPGGGFGGWKPGAHDADGEEHGKEVEEDKDGGLPSDVHPNSVRTKAVDMDGEASKAMEILGALLGKGGGGGDDGGPREESRRIKNGGKSKKKARETPKEGTLEEGGGGGASGSVGKTDVAAQRQAMDADSSGPAEGEQSPPAGTSPEETGKNADDESPTAEAKSAGSGGAEATVALASRKNRARIAAAAATAATADAAAGGTVPLPEHHARPRELSRRAAVRPLASARSAHVMAAGPGATFAALNLPPKMVSHLEEPKGNLGGGGMGLAGPTVCQLAAVPVLAAGNNTVIKSETGSGKTLAYLLPMLCDLASVEPRVDREKGTLAIVLAPTRELGSQILEVLTRVVRPFIWLVPGSLSGGERRKSEKARLRKGVTVLVCTPGRLLDHLKTTKCFRRDSLRWLILDEADRLLDMGFEKQVKEIVELLDQSARAVRSGPAGGSRVQGGAVVPSTKVIRRQTVMVSATLDKGVSRLSAALLSKHIRVDADTNVVESVDEAGKVKHISGERGASSSKTKTRRNEVHGGGDGLPSQGTNGSANTEEFSTPRQLVQYYMTVTQKLRLPALCAFLRARAAEKVVVFMSTCDAVDFHHDLFRRAGWPGDSPSPSPDGGEGSPNETGRSSGGSAEDNGKKKTAATAGKKPLPDGEFFGPGCLVRRLHGNVPQNERQATYRAFGAAKSGILICTDVAARGLDLPTVDWIVQYDPPAETADYVHRVGRTARKGERGHSLLFLLPREVAYLGVLEARGLRPKPLSLEGVLCAADAGKRDARRADEQLAYELQQGLQLLVAGDKPLLDRARSAFQSHVRAYAARAPDSRAVFQVRSLHLGHVARSFALKDPPTAVKVGKRVVRRPGDGGGRGKGGDGGGGGGGGASRGEKRRRDGAGGSGGSVHRLGLSKQTELASRAEFL
ncbi:unnamed protein product [Ectocarpus sp. 6 AP-2014]